MAHKGALAKGGRAAASQPPPGQGGRFQKLKASIEERNRTGPKRPDVAKKRPGGGKIEDVGALSAFLGRKKYGKQRFQQMAAAGRRGAY